MELRFTPGVGEDTQMQLIAEGELAKFYVEMVQKRYKHYDAGRLKRLASSKE